MRFIGVSSSQSVIGVNRADKRGHDGEESDVSVRVRG